MLSIILFLNVTSTIAMAGIIWFVQIVHYPLFTLVGSDQFSQYEKMHQQLTTYVVAPLMLIEFASSFVLCFQSIKDLAAWIPYLGLAMVIAIWLSTFFIQVPMHGRLDGSFDAEALSILVTSNWIRTILWSLRVPLVLWIFSKACA